MNAVLTTCFKRMGIELNIIPMPSERSLYNANAGLQDGNFVRTRGISEFHPNLIMVPEPVSKNIITAFSKDLTIKVNGWKSLLPYHVVWVRGWKNCERELKDANLITRVNNEQLLFHFLDEGRAQVGVFGLETGLELIGMLGVRDVHPLSPPIVESDLFLYLNKKHEDKVDLVAKTLREMKKDGTYDNILARFYNYRTFVK